MSDFRKCETCGEYAWFIMAGSAGGHQCAPRWQVLDIENNGRDWDEAVICYGITASDAATKWGEREDDDSGEDEIVKGTPATVLVRPEPDDDNDDDPDGLMVIVTGGWVAVYGSELAQSMKCPRHGCSQYGVRVLLDEEKIGSVCEFCGVGRIEASTMLPPDPEAVPL